MSTFEMFIVEVNGVSTVNVTFCLSMPRGWCANSFFLRHFCCDLGLVAVPELARVDRLLLRNIGLEEDDEALSCDEANSVGLVRQIVAS